MAQIYTNGLRGLRGPEGPFSNITRNRAWEITHGFAIAPTPTNEITKAGVAVSAERVADETKVGSSLLLKKVAAGGVGAVIGGILIKLVVL